PICAHNALHFQLTSQHGYNSLTDAETETRPCISDIDVLTALIKSFKNIFHLVLRNPDSRVTHGTSESDLFLGLCDHFYLQADLSFISELDRIRDQVHEYLAHFNRISNNEFRKVWIYADFQLQVFAPGLDPLAVKASVYGCAKIKDLIKNL